MGDRSDGSGAVAPQHRRARRAVPAPRAVVGGLLVTLAAVASLLAFTGGERPPGGTWVVVTRDVDAGEVLEPDALAVVHADLPAPAADAIHAAPDDLTGAVALTPLRSGDPVLRSAVLTGRASTDVPAAHEFSFALERERAVNAALERGEVVDVVATYGTGEAARTVVTARGASVLDIERGEDGGLAAGGMVVLTLAVTAPDEVLALAHAADVAEVTVVRATRTGATLPARYRPDETAG